MKSLIPVVLSVMFAIWIVVIALLSVQNATLVSVSFLFFESIRIPVGVILSFALAIGMIVGAIAPWFGKGYPPTLDQDPNDDY